MLFANNQVAKKMEATPGMYLEDGNPCFWNLRKYLGRKNDKPYSDYSRN